ncbi:MAG: KpsF/GutQ family sugar-phosphate isomerase [Armatimonadetes bacterium]|nr:KpsF/GutQ family sugar-phosphate isomerase [Armatimonadota bacterium]
MIHTETYNFAAAAREVLRLEAEAIAALADRLDARFDAACQLLLACHGRVVVTGMGKSGAVARKIAATLASTGTPALFLHPAEGVHGDLGMVTAGDAVVALSYSGESDELRAILPILKRLRVPLIAMTGKPGSTLAEYADVVLDVAVEREACPLNLAPTSSTTAMLALGDALALAVMQARRFTPEDFALFHPGGALGRRLLMRVSDLMRTGERMAVVPPTAAVREALFAITRAQAGCVFVVGEDGALQGLLSDGDIRRLLLKDEHLLRSPVGEVMFCQPRTIAPDRLVTEAVALMEQLPPCSELPVLDEAGRPIGVLNLKDVVRAGVA